MRLPDFIVANRAPILAEWDTFARSCTPASGAMNCTALRDHAGEMLATIVADLRTRESEPARAEKSKGNAPTDGAAVTTAAEAHGSGRAASGFTMAQMIAEYRALRASVLRLWTQAHSNVASAADLDDVTRFNEAIDQALAESVSRFSEELDHSKEMFLAILGHDLRTPLGAIYTSAQFMLESQELAEPYQTLAASIARSSTRMTQMVADLLDFTRGRLGGGIPVVRAEVRMEQVVRAVIDEVAAAHPCRVIEFDGDDDDVGQWDSARISEALANLLSNALEHGAGDTVVRVSLRGDEGAVEVTLHNFGPPIPGARLGGLFDPMKASTMAGGERASGPLAGLGLGLYIAERIVHAHEGRIDVTSEEVRGTTFTVHLPRRGEAMPA